jgi:hypothetical protein
MGVKRLWVWLAAASLLSACVDGSIGDGPDGEPSDDGRPVAGTDGGEGDPPDDEPSNNGGGMDTPPPEPEQLTPCANGSCWDTEAYVPECGHIVVGEDFSSGNYNVHRYAGRVYEDALTTISLDSAVSGWQPAIIVARPDGQVLFDGTIGAITPSLTAQLIEADDASMVVTIDSDTTLDVDVFVTSVPVIESDFVAAISTEVTYELDIVSDCSTVPGDLIAPAGAVAGETLGNVGDNAISLGAGDWGPALRYDLSAGNHLAFELAFSPGSAAVDMQVLMWTGSQVEEMAVTNGGSGERVLSVLDADHNRTYWVRALGSVSSATLHAETTPFQEGPQCFGDCDRLLQLPLANDPAVEGYDSADYVVYRYQYGRRDVLMSLRHAGRTVVAAGVKPFTVQDLSKADGTQPPGHASHTYGKDVDLSVYDANGDPVWYPLCDEVANECIAGTDSGFNGEAMARKIAPMLESGRVTHIFLDAEFHATLFDAAETLVQNGQMAPGLLPTMQDVVQHWPNHNNHIHVRYETSAY